MSKANKDKWREVFGKHEEKLNILNVQRPSVGNFTA
jgi:hypothetical protein